MWSMGCIIYELATGRLLYDTHDNLEHLHLMEKTLSKLPVEWARTCRNDEVRDCFVQNTEKLRPLPIGSAAKLARTRAIKEMIADASLLDLVTGCLSYDRQKRLTARQVMSHPFVSTYFPESIAHPNHPRSRANVVAEPRK
jgi:dual-specificity kinase